MICQPHPSPHRSENATVTTHRAKTVVIVKTAKIAVTVAAMHRAIPARHRAAKVHQLLSAASMHHATLEPVVQRPRVTVRPQRPCPQTKARPQWPAASKVRPRHHATPHATLSARGLPARVLAPLRHARRCAPILCLKNWRSCTRSILARCFCRSNAVFSKTSWPRTPRLLIRRS